MRKEPKTLSFDEFADELLQEHQPRALVILAAAQIDNQLRGLLEEFLLPKVVKPKEPDELLEGDNPLSSFSSRIKICKRLGVLDDQLTDAFNRLRDIRNQAAHWISFGVAGSPLREQLKHLQSLVITRRSYKLTTSRFFNDQTLSEFESLQAVLLTLSVLIETIRKKLSAKSLRKTPKLHNIN
jgi:DNA-binding MltR family transcriptional regulator